MVTLKAILMFIFLAPISVGIVYLGSFLGRILFFVGRAYLFYSLVWLYHALALGNPYPFGTHLWDVLSKRELDFILAGTTGGILILLGTLIAHLAVTAVRKGRYISRTLYSCFLSGITVGVAYMAFLKIEEMKYQWIEEMYEELEHYWNLLFEWKMEDLSVALLGVGILLYGVVKWARWRKEQLIE